jgi:hypothetical protein
MRAWLWFRDNLLRSPETLTFAQEIERLRHEREALAHLARVRAHNAGRRQ